MIYLNDNTNPQSAILPMSVEFALENVGETRFLLFSTVNRKREVDAAMIGDFNNDFNADFAYGANIKASKSGQFYRVDMAFNTIPQKGEYEYAIASQNKGILGRGIAIVGEYHSQRTEYGNTKEYKQYGA